MAEIGGREDGAAQPGVEGVVAGRLNRPAGRHAMAYTCGLPDLSYSRGADAPLLEKTIFQALSDTAERFPDREALVVCHQQARYTWSGLREAAERVARAVPRAYGRTRPWPYITWPDRSPVWRPWSITTCPLTST